MLHMYSYRDISMYKLINNKKERLNVSPLEMMEMASCGQLKGFFIEIEK